MLYGFKQYHMKYILFNKAVDNDDIVEISVSQFFIELKRFYYFFYCLHFAISPFNFVNNDIFFVYFFNKEKLYKISFCDNSSVILFRSNVI